MTNLIFENDVLATVSVIFEDFSGNRNSVHAKDANQQIQWPPSPMPTSPQAVPSMLRTKIFACSGSFSNFRRILYPLNVNNSDRKMKTL